MKEKVSAEDRGLELRRKTKKKYSAEQEVRVVLERDPRRREHRNPVPARTDTIESVFPVVTFPRNQVNVESEESGK